MCAIFGVFNQKNAAELVAFGLHSNQHRAIDYGGIVSSSDGEPFHSHHGVGLVRQIFTREALGDLHGNQALGHIRYPTVTDDKNKSNIQPLVGTYNGLPIAIAHNGNITNTPELAKRIPPSKLLTSMDTEYILRLLEECSTGDIEKDIATVFALIEGSVALGVMLPDRLIAVNDKSDNRPLSIGRLHNGYCISSETCAFTSVKASYLCDVEPGTMVSLSNEGMKSYRFAEPREKKCRFESLYFSHPGSVVFGEPVARFRIAIGEALEEHFPVIGADIVTPIPDSSTFFAIGFGKSGRSGIYFPVITRSHYVGRTFIAATQAKRDAAVAQKFTFICEEIRGKTIVVLDDSIVRCTTLPKVVKELKRLGAKAVHVRIGSPPIKHPCIYGINTPTQEELIAASKNSEEIRAMVGADSLEFLPLELLKKLTPQSKKFCFACMSGEYW